MNASHPVSPPYFLRSARLGFRHWSPGDLPLAQSLWGNPDVTHFIGGPFTADQINARLRNEIATQREHGVQYWPIFLLQTGEHVGCCGLRPYDLPARIFEIGFHLKPAYWGQGYAAEAARVVIGYTFSDLHASALFAGHNPANEASRRLLLRLGFRYTHDEYYAPTGLYHPSYRLNNPTENR